MLLTLRRRLHGEHGFSMLVTLAVLTVCASLTAAAFGSVTGDIPLRKESRDKKSAYAAAEAGLNFYLSRLAQDNAYWTKCTTVPAPNATEPSPVVQRWDGAGTDPRTPSLRSVPGDPRARYVVELLPFVGATCTPATSASTMFDPSTGFMRIRATGVAGQEKRSIIGALRRKSFLDFLYFTDYENVDPAVYSTDPAIAAACRTYRAARGTSCREIQFGDSDRLNGPFHTNDNILSCGAPVFGETAGDRLEVSGPAPGFVTSCSGTPVFKSPLQTAVTPLAPPDSNSQVASVAVAPYVLTGAHRIVLNGTMMTITPQGGAPYVRSLPANGVISVRNGTGCGAGVSPLVQNYDEPAGCANVKVSGTYAKSLTLVSDKDIVVDGNLTGTGDSLIGLIATNFVRVYHPVVRTDTKKDGPRCVNNTSAAPVGTPTNITIEAAILSLQHSFIVDNYDCGDPMGTLTVKGAIAQRFRGPVSGGGRGYPTKNYIYDRRMRFRNPPYFLDPVAAAFRLVRQNEQVPAR